MNTFRPARLPDRPAPRSDGRPDFLGPPLGYRGRLRPLLQVPEDRRWHGYKGEVTLRHGVPTGGFWRDGSGHWWAWGEYAA